MDRGTRVFWLLIAVLLTASALFARGAIARRAALADHAAVLHTGDVVQLSRVVDGDSMILRTESGDLVPVRILGVKALEPRPEKSVGAAYGRAAMLELEKLVGDEPMRVMLHTTEKDRHGRFIASLFVGEKDVGLALIKRGLALAYPVYPFPTLSMYLEEQAKAHSAGTGLWGDPAVARRAEALTREWGRRSE